MVMTDWRNRFKARFQVLRASGVTQTDLGELIGVSQGTVGHWINGRRAPQNLEQFEKIADALGVSLQWLLTGDDEEQPQSEQSVAETKGKYQTYSKTDLEILGILTKLNKGKKAAFLEIMRDALEVQSQRDSRVSAKPALVKNKQTTATAKKKVK